MPNHKKFCWMTWMWRRGTYSHLKFFQLCPQLVKFVSIFGELSLNWHGVAERRVWFVHLLHLHEAVSCCRLLTDLWKKQIMHIEAVKLNAVNHKPWRLSRRSSAVTSFAFGWAEGRKSPPFPILECCWEEPKIGNAFSIWRRCQRHLVQLLRQTK